MPWALGPAFWDVCLGGQRNLQGQEPCGGSLSGTETARWPPAVPRAWWVRGSGFLGEGGVVTPEAGDLGLGLSIGNVCQEDVPSAVYHGKIFYQRNLS